MIKKVKEALEKDDIDDIKEAKDKLQERALALATKAYEEAAKARQAEGGDDTTTDSSSDDNVQEANYEEK